MVATKQLTHLYAEDRNSLLCGAGTWMRTVTIINYPSVNNLPGCRQCRERFLAYIGVEVDAATGYPVGHAKATDI